MVFFRKAYFLLEIFLAKIFLFEGSYLSNDMIKMIVGGGMLLEEMDCVVVLFWFDRLSGAV